MAFVAMELGDQGALVEFLTPLIKVFCTEAGMRSAELGIQVLGGYGFLREYRIEQTYRDARITAIYEGAKWHPQTDVGHAHGPRSQCRCI